MHAPTICLSPQYLAEDLLRLEGFSEVEYVEAAKMSAAELVASGNADVSGWDILSMIHLMDQKQPELHRIDSQRSRAAKLAEPDFIVSFAVLKHVPPAELRAYFKNIISMMGPRTQVIITFNQGSRTLRTGGAIWDYCSEDIIDCIQDIDHALECKFSPFSTTEKDLAPPCKSILLIERTRILGTFG